MVKNLCIRVGWAFICTPKEETLYILLVGPPVESKPLKIKKNLRHLNPLRCDVT
jgi:hypothetical protein